MVINQQLNDRQEPGCSVILADKKYFHVGCWFMEQTLRQHEWQTVSGDNNDNNTIIVPPTTYPQRWKTDAAILRFLRRETNIPLPPAECTFEDDGAFYLQTQYVEGVSMQELEREEDRQVVMEELERHVATLRALRSAPPPRGGVPGETLLCAPQRATSNQWKMNSCWRPRKEATMTEEEEEETKKNKGSYVFCHNDLGQHNVIVDLDTLKIKAVIDWEFGGFWPEWLRGHSGSVLGRVWLLRGTTRMTLSDAGTGW